MNSTAWGLLALLAVLVMTYLVSRDGSIKKFIEDDGDWFAAVPDDRPGSAGDGIEWYPPYVLPSTKGWYWTKHPEAPNHVFEGTRWNGNMWISEDGHPCYYQQREWAYPVEQVAA